MKECPACLFCQEDAANVCPVDGTTLRSDLPGSTVLDGKYKLERRLGVGGMGIVYRARHLGLERTCALKLIRFKKEADRGFLARFRIEAKALGRLKHPNIVGVMDFGVDPREGGVPYLVMEYLEGQTLAEYCREAGPLPLGEALSIFDAIARAIDHAHEHGILHRDLKPANVFLSSSEPAGRTVKILDFGLARLLADVGPRPTREPRQDGAGVIGSKFEDSIGSGAVAQAQTLALSTVNVRAQPASEIDDVRLTMPEDSVGSPASAQAETLALPTVSVSVRPTSEIEDLRLTVPGSIFGTLPYLAPELLRGVEAAAASDNYAFGALIFEVLVGRAPFVGSPADVMTAHLQDSPSIPAAACRSLPEEVRAAMLAPLEKDPALRPKSAGDVVERIRSAAARADVRSWRAREIPRRLKISALLGALLTGLSAPLWRVEPVEWLEAKTVGARFQAAVSHEPDHRILLLTVDESSLAADRTPLAQRADEFGGRLERVFGAGARSVAIDFLLPETWSQSEIFSRFVLNHAPALTLAGFSPSGGTVVGPECINGLTAAALGPERAGELFGLVNLEEDRDGMTRTARFSYDDRQGSQRPSWAARAVRTMRVEDPYRPGISPHSSKQRFWIDYAVDWTRFQRISWKELDLEVDRDPRVFRDRLVIVGGDFAASGDEMHPVPHLRGASPEVSGLVLQALIANTMLTGLPIHEAGMVLVLLAVALGSTIVGAAFLCLRHLYLSVFTLLGIVAMFLTVALVDFRWSQVVVPVTGPVMTLGVVALLGLGLRRKLASFPDLYQEAR
jgi:serine/threonine protein kinase